jgi:CRISPR-associated RAMP protein (TIGR02581 family)
VLTPEGKPFGPGSSFKGALRSTIEKLVPMLPGKAELRSCGLPTKEDANSLCPTARQFSIAQAKRARQMQPGAPEYDMEEEIEKLCHTCQLFGSPFAAARINVNDLYLWKEKKSEKDEGKEEWSGIIQVRDGVAIDRDSEKAKDRLKYDFEVVPPSTAFALTITLENATLQDLQLISIGLSEFVQGFGAIGGKRSRGLGACSLENLVVSSLELTGIGESERNKRLQNYLLKRRFSTHQEPGDQFLTRHIDSIFATK